MRRYLLSLLLLCLMIVMPAGAQSPAPIAQRTSGMTRADGFIPFYWDASRGRILLEISKFDSDILYYVSTAASPGSVELGMDRGVDAQKVVHFQRIGPKVLVVEQNLRYRALNGSAALKENVRDSFASSVLASLPIEAEEGDRVLVDATPLVVRDATGTAAALRQRQQGTFHLDPSRSGVYMARTKAFPKNTEIEVILTFDGDTPGILVENVTPEPSALTLRQHHSFVEAPTGTSRARPMRGSEIPRSLSRISQHPSTPKRR